MKNRKSRKPRFLFSLFFSFLFFHAHSRFYSCGSGWKFLSNNGGNDDKTIKFNLTLAPRPHFVPGICWIHMRKWVMAFNFKLQTVRRALFPDRLRVRYQLVNCKRIWRQLRDYHSKSSLSGFIFYFFLRFTLLGRFLNNSFSCFKIYLFVSLKSDTIFFHVWPTEKPEIRIYVSIRHSNNLLIDFVDNH